MRSVVIASPKGGDGKTTLALNLAFAMARRGWRILLVESDPQGALGASLSPSLQRASGLVGLALHNHPLERARVLTRQAGLHILPTGILPRANSALWRSVIVQQAILRQIVEQASPQYDLCLFDTPAGLNDLTLASMRASQSLLLPLQAEPLALRAFPQMLEQLHWLNSEGYPLSLTGIALTLWDASNPISSAVLHEIHQRFPAALLFRTPIPRDGAFLEASALGSPLGLMPPRFQPFAMLFEQLAAELEERLLMHDGFEANEQLSLIDEDDHKAP